ncbi:hypothetical protein PLANPX_3705 [Lacipirellula parvula]|uniref:Uncharacterized protein n=1 Tax=Lacipirellula parvula TaxID=2650471 RepID=A0A5K7XIT9_9BACT|nr:hypothetical protein PLANPX_3705 [Lacipirellula parvula]
MTTRVSFFDKLARLAVLVPVGEMPAGSTVGVVAAEPSRR